MAHEAIDRMVLALFWCGIFFSVVHYFFFLVVDGFSVLVFVAFMVCGADFSVTADGIFDTFLQYAYELGLDAYDYIWSQLVKFELRVALCG